MKRPKNLPQVGDEVRWRGRDQYGILKQHNADNDWCMVEWDSTDAPKIVHLFELERASEQNEDSK